MDNDESHDHVLPGSDEELNTPAVRGYDFRGEFDFHEMLDAYATTGFKRRNSQKPSISRSVCRTKTRRYISRSPRISSHRGYVRPSRISSEKAT